MDRPTVASWAVGTGVAKLDTDAVRELVRVSVGTESIGLTPATARHVAALLLLSADYVENCGTAAPGPHAA